MSALDAAVGLVAKNSVDYVRTFHRLASASRTVVPLRSLDDAARIRSCGIDECVDPKNESGWICDHMLWGDSPQIAQVAFTSGTEGEEKGILLTHANLASTVARLQDKMHIDRSIREYVGVPVYHSFGFARCRLVLSVGGAVFIPSAGFNIPELIRQLQNDEVNSISAVPSLWRLVLKFRESFASVSHKVRWIEIGSQPMSQEEKLELRQLFPNAVIVQHYGLTEASRSTFLDVSDVTVEELASVGKPNGDVQVDINPEGRIKIRGSNVAREMIRAGVRVPLVDGDGWLTTNDLGEIRRENLHYLGRADDVINVAGIKIAPDAIERGMVPVLGVADDYCIVRVPDALRGDGILVVSAERLPFSNEQLVDAASQSLRRLGVDARLSLSVMRVADLPTTDAGKVKRKQLAQQFQSGKPLPQASDNAMPLGEGTTHSSPDLFALPSEDTSLRINELHSIYAQVFPTASIKSNDSFVSLGGDSLSFVELSTALEATIGQLPKGWQQLSIEQLAAKSITRSWLHSMDLSVALRAVAIVAIVAGHFGFGDVHGGAFLLLVVAGFNFARFQLGAVFANNSVNSILWLAGKVALPTTVAMAILGARHLTVDLPGLLLVKNWFADGMREMDYWFLEVLVQILLIVAILLSFRRVREACSRHPFGMSVVLFLASMILVGIGPWFWNSKQVYDRVPHMLIWLFFLGWAAQCARSWPERLLVAVLAVAATTLVWADASFWEDHAQIWVIVGTILLLCVGTVRIPWPVNRIVAIVAAASLFIYITHQPLYGVWHKLGVVLSPPLEVALAVALGVAVYAVWQRLMTACAQLVAGWKVPVGKRKVI